MTTPLNEGSPSYKQRTNTVGHVWYLGTEVSNHTTDDKDQYSELNLSVGGTVQFGDGRTIDIRGRGTILFELEYCGHKVLTDVSIVKSERNHIRATPERNLKPIVKS
jgi:hypothetical protein